MSLARSSAAGASWVMVANVVKSALQLAQLVVLTRLLLPKDYGLMALVLVIISYANLFSDMGLSTAFIHRQTISKEERSSLYWLSVLVGAVLMLLVMLTSPLLAKFYGEAQLVPLLMLVSTSFVLVAVGQQLRMDAEKRLLFKPVALIEITAALAGFVVAVISAWCRWGVYALVLGALCSALVTSVFNWLYLSEGWRPLWRLRLDEVRWFIRFGGGMVMNNVINHINATVDLLLGGRLLGVSQLGLYSVPRNLILQIQFMVNPIFTRVGFPVISSIQHDSLRVRQVYLKIMNLTATVNAPIYIAIFVFSPEMVQVLLGVKFAASAPLLRVLALWGLFRSFGNPVGSLLFGLGKVRLSIIWNAGVLLLAPPVLWLGARNGTIGMAWMMASLMAVLFIPGWAFLIRPTCRVGFWLYARQVLLPIANAVVAGLVGFLAVFYVEPPLNRLVIGFFGGGLCYAALTWIVNGEVRTLFHNVFNK